MSTKLHAILFAVAALTSYMLCWAALFGENLTLLIFGTAGFCVWLVQLNFLPVPSKFRNRRSPEFWIAWAGFLVGAILVNLFAFIIEIRGLL